MKKIIFRVDASPILATGHIMRCLTLAQAFKIKYPQARIIFIANQLPDNLTIRLMEASVELITLPFDIDSKDWQQVDDAKATVAAILASVNLTSTAPAPINLKTENLKTETLKNETLSNLVDLLIVDHYLIDWQWQTRVKSYCKKLVVIDDLANRKHIADFLLDQTLNRQANDYLTLVPPYCQLLLGQKFMLLREEFKQLIASAKQKRITTASVNKVLRNNIPKNTEINIKTNTEINTAPETNTDNLKNSTLINNILVNLGGLDNHNVTKTIINALVDYKKHTQNLKLTVDVVMASHSPHVAQIKTLSADFSWLTLTLDCTEMAKKMLNADLAIGACGATAWERCSLGLPTLGIVLASNQERVNKNLADQNAIINLGNYQEITAKQIIDAILFLESKPNNYMRLVKNSFKSCDGLGTENVVSRLTTANVSLTKATLNDLELTFKWQSNEDIRRYSRNPNPVVFEEHKQWFLSSLTMKNRHVFMICKGQTKLGILRLDKQEGMRYEISILIAPESQGMKLALQGIHAIPNTFDHYEIYAHVHPKNKASQRLFNQANFIKLTENSYLRPAYITLSE